ncbi:MAG: DUF4293 domain-containing protein [Flavobacteriales bacterium]|nr:DUF4293 domain-containing protein [Flavobacteriales bacterium]
MIQRIQTMYLLAGAILISLIFFVPLGGFKSPIEVLPEGTLYLYKQVIGLKQESTPAMLLSPSLALAFLGFLINIFLFKNRKRQIKVARYTSIFLISIAVLQFIFMNRVLEMSFNTGYELNYKTGFFLVIPALIFNLLAARSIKKDEELVKSVDRIR